VEVVNALSEDHFNEKDLAVLQLVARLASFVFGRTEEILDKTEDNFSEDDLN